MQASANRTFICSVLFLEIPGYAQRPVAEQVSLKERFNALLGEALKTVPAKDRIVLDTGSGAAVSFIGNPEDALTVAARLAALLDLHGPTLDVRCGINLGPVKLIKDVNGQPNIIGDGLNVAQRIMAFAEAGQVLASRPYYEVLCRLSDAHARRFDYLGSRTDDHVRAHEVYALRSPGGANEDAPTVKLAALEAPEQPVPPAASGRRAYLLVRWALLGAPLGAAALIVVALALREGSPPRSGDVPPSPPPPVAGTDPYAGAPAPEPPAEQSPPPRPASSRPAEALRLGEPVPVAPEETPKPPAPPAAPQSTPEAVRKQAAATPAVPPPAPAPGAVPAAIPSAHLEFAISPWGEIYVDGKLAGVSPPLHKLDVAPGTHTIEVRNSDLPVHRQTIHVDAGERVKIKHKFR
ncbi:hypothetical protein [Pelomicrobium sp. G1]|uniref:hypothetical protein n=1 Tax=unclassified Pelomicrobium TaxID=2815318 RepID=UPI003F76CAC0